MNLLKSPFHPLGKAPGNTVGPRSAGFTRADLLTLLGLLGLIMLIHRPVQANSRSAGQTVTCLNNLRRLTLAWLAYAEDYSGRLPGNTDDGSTAGLNWVGGNVTSSPADSSVALLIDKRYAQLGPYTRDAAIYRCPADPSTTRVGSVTVPRVRSYSMNGAVGSNGYKAGAAAPVDGAWLDGNHNHVANKTWRTFGNLTSIIEPPPAKLFVFITEDEYSINDGCFAMAMTEPPKMIDWPETRHDYQGTLSYADGRAEAHRWQDLRTRVAYGQVGSQIMPDNQDLRWLQARTSAPVR